MKRNFLTAAVTPVVMAVSIAVSLTPTPSLAASSTSSGWGAFWQCWWDRDFEGDGRTFTGGCWDRHMGITIPSGTESELKAFQASYFRELETTPPAQRQALKQSFLERGQSMAQPLTDVGAVLEVHEPLRGNDGLPGLRETRPIIQMPGPIN